MVQIYRTILYKQINMENISTSDERFIDRLELFMKTEGLNANKLTVAANLSNGLVGKTLKKRASMNSDSIERILYSFPRLSADWLMTGRGEMYPSNSNELVNADSLMIFLRNKNNELEMEVRKLLQENAALKIKLELFTDSGGKTECG